MIARELLGVFLDWLLGPRCLVCGQRVFPGDVEVHDEIEHPGDRAA